MVAARAPRSAGWAISDEDLAEVNDQLARYEQEPEVPKLSANDLNECVGEVMRVCIAHNSKKPCVPIAHKTIADALKAIDHGAPGIAKGVLKHAQHRFARLGFELLEFKSGEKGVAYKLRSVLPGAFLAELVNTEQENCMAGLQLLLQLFLHLKGDKVTEDEVLAHLARFGLHLHPLKEQARRTDDEEVIEKFGTHTPLGALVDQKFLALKRVEGAQGAMEEMLCLGDAAKGAAAEMTPSETQRELEDLMDG